MLDESGLFLYNVGRYVNAFLYNKIVFLPWFYYCFNYADVLIAVIAFDTVDVDDGCCYINIYSIPSKIRG